MASKSNFRNLTANPLYFILFIVCLCKSQAGFAQTDKSYLSSDKIFILTYPADWKKAGVLSTSGELLLNAPDNSMFKRCQVKVEINTIDEAYKGYSLKEISEVELKMLRATKQEQLNLEVLSSDFKTFNKKEWWVIHGKMHQGKEVYITDSYKTIHSGKLYVVTYYSVEKSFEKNAPAALKMVETLEFLTKDITVYNESQPEKKTSTEKKPH